MGLEDVPEAYQPSYARCLMTEGITETMMNPGNCRLTYHVKGGVMLTFWTDTVASFVSVQVYLSPTTSGSAKSLGKSGILKTHLSSWMLRKKVKMTKATSIWNLKSMLLSFCCNSRLMYFQFVHPQDQGRRNYTIRCVYSLSIAFGYMF